MKIIKKDITTVTNGFIAHGVNCRGAMGSGVARALFTKWPLIRSQFLTRGTGKRMLGLIDVVNVEPNVTVFNCYTQLSYGGDGARYANVGSLMASLLDVAAVVDHAGHRQIHIPKIGCDLGGLSFENDLIPIVEQIERMHDVEFVICVID